MLKFSTDRWMDFFMISLFDSFVDITKKSYALTILIDNTLSKTVLVLENIDECENRRIQLLEFLPEASLSLTSNQTWNEALSYYELTIEKNKTLQAINEEIKILNLNAFEKDGRNICPEIPISSSSTYCVSKEKAQTLLTNCMSQENLPLSCNNSYLCTAHQLKNIGITPPRITDDPACIPNISLNLFGKTKFSKNKTIPKQTITQAEQEYLTYLRALENEIAAASKIEIKDPALVLSSDNQKQHQLRIKALYEANRVIAELKKQLPLTADKQRLEAVPQKYARSPNGVQLKDKTTQKPYLINDDALLLRLADICSHMAQGLHFIATNEKTFFCEIFDHSGTTKQVAYDTETHKISMAHLDSMAHSLKGSGWKNCRKALLILASIMLIAAGILAVVPTGSVSLAIALGGVAALTAGAGFFTGCDTGLTRAVRGVKMKGLEKPDDITSPGNKA